MERRNFLKSVTVAGFAGVALTSCANETTTSNVGTLRSGAIFHVVYFWLKDGITAAEEQDFLNFFEELRKIPVVETLHYGKPAPTHPRPVVDNSFQYNLLVSFQDMEAINTYETHPIHLEAIEQYKQYWTKVEVRDTVIA